MASSAAAAAVTAVPSASALRTISRIVQKQSTSSCRRCCSTSSAASSSTTRYSPANATSSRLHFSTSSRSVSPLLNMSSSSSSQQQQSRSFGSTSNLSTTTKPLDVIQKKELGARIFLLNRNESLNALNLNMIRMMMPQMQVWDQSDLCHLIVLMKNLGSKAFCAGGDVKDIVTKASSGAKEDIAAALKFFEEEYRLNHLIGTIDTPMVALMDGITMGGGVGISVHAPFRIATEHTVFAMPETKIGLIPDVGGTFFLPRLDGQLGTYLGLSGDTLKGEEVFMAGIATHYVPSNRIPALMSRLCELETSDLGVIHNAIEEFSAEPPSAEHWSKWKLGGETKQLINECFRHNTIEEIIASLSKLNNPWAESVLSRLKKASPTSLKVTLKALRRGATMDFASCLKMEYKLVQKFLVTKDFFEGVDALLITKGKKPVWQPSWEEMMSQGKLTDEWVERTYFGEMASLNRPTKAKFSHDAPAKDLILTSDRTYFEYPHRFVSGLPRDQEIAALLQSDQQATVDDIVTFFQKNWGTAQFMEEVAPRVYKDMQGNPMSKFIGTAGVRTKGKGGVVPSALVGKVQAVVQEVENTPVTRQRKGSL